VQYMDWLHARIATASSWQEVRQLFEEHEGYVNPRHVLLLLSQLGQLSRRAPAAAAVAAGAAVGGCVPIGRDEQAAYQELVTTLVSVPAWLLDRQCACVRSWQQSWEGYV
jgi:hypothetical protein